MIVYNYFKYKAQYEKPNKMDIVGKNKLKKEDHMLKELAVGC
jgi:hypothetical protein